MELLEQLWCNGNRSLAAFARRVVRHSTFGIRSAFGLRHCIKVMHFLRDVMMAHPLVLGFWVLVIGGAIGSFLNVVVYRLPRGMSLSKPASHCPKCGHAIRWYHNLPVAGWLLLRAKCYDCKAAISPRYPAVELFVAVLFVGLAYFDVYLPTLRESLEAEIPMNSAPANLRLVLRLLTFVAQAWLACSLLAAALIRWDAGRVPWRLVVPCVVVAAVAAASVNRYDALIFLALATAVLALKVSTRMKKPPAETGG
jgi:leader peptidase (prepilin peptidase) / N-methyltransferase